MGGPVVFCLRALAVLTAWLVAAGAARADLPQYEFWPEVDYAFGTSKLQRRLMDEREFTTGRTSTVPFVNVEPCYDSRYETVNRVRLIAGGSVAWSPRAAIETNATYQYDSHSSVKEIFALNVILHLYLDASRGK